MEDNILNDVDDMLSKNLNDVDDMLGMALILDLRRENRKLHKIVCDLRKSVWDLRKLVWDLWRWAICLCSSCEFHTEDCDAFLGQERPCPAMDSIMQRMIDLKIRESAKQ